MKDYLNTYYKLYGLRVVFNSLINAYRDDDSTIAGLMLSALFKGSIDIEYSDMLKEFCLLSEFVRNRIESEVKKVDNEIEVYESIFIPANIIHSRLLKTVLEGLGHNVEAEGNKLFIDVKWRDLCDIISGSNIDYILKMGNSFREPE